MAAGSEKETVIGEVIDVSAAKPLGEGRWFPAFISLKTDDGPGELKFFPKKDWDTKVILDPIQLGNVWDTLVKQYGDPPEALAGKTIVATAVPKEPREGVLQWADLATAKVMGGSTPAKEQVDTPLSTPPVKPVVVDRQDQIMLQHGTGVSASCYNVWILLPVESRGTFKDYLKNVAIGGTWLLKHAYQSGGYVEPVGPTPEPEPNEIDPDTMDSGPPEDAVLGTV